jgi:hypothetical protein
MLVFGNFGLLAANGTLYAACNRSVAEIARCENRKSAAPLAPRSLGIAEA